MTEKHAKMKDLKSKAEKKQKNQIIKPVRKVRTIRKAGRDSAGRDDAIGPGNAGSF